MLTPNNLFKDFINLNDLTMDTFKDIKWYIQIRIKSTYIQDVFLNDGMNDDADQNVEKHSE